MARSLVIVKTRKIGRWTFSILEFKKGRFVMRKKIWITKNWGIASCIMVWFKKPVWHPNKNRPKDDSGYWGDAKGQLSGHPFLHDALNGLFKVSFRKLRDQHGYIAERVISVNLSK